MAEVEISKVASELKEIFSKYGIEVGCDVRGDLALCIVPDRRLGNIEIELVKSPTGVNINVSVPRGTRWVAELSSEEYSKLLNVIRRFYGMEEIDIPLLYHDDELIITKSLKAGEIREFLDRLGFFISRLKRRKPYIEVRKVHVRFARP